MPLSETKIKNIGDLRKLIKDLPDKLPTTAWGFNGEEREDLFLYAIKEDKKVSFAGSGKWK